MHCLVPTLALLLLLVHHLSEIDGRRRPVQAGQRADEKEDEDVTKTKPAAKRRRVSEYLKAPLLVESSTDAPYSEEFNNLMSDELSDRDDFLEAHHLYTSAHKTIIGETLAFVTPWNKKGYTNSVLMREKIEWLAPVWYQVRRGDKDGKIVISGRHEEDVKWLRNFKPSSSSTSKKCEIDIKGSTLCTRGGDFKVKIVPRVSVETKLETEKDVEDTVNGLVRILNSQHILDGFTLEMALDGDSIMIPVKLRNKYPSMKLVMVMPPLEMTDANKERVTRAFGMLSQYIDRFAIMTYDHDKSGSKALAPFDWVNSIMAGLASIPQMRHKLLLGLPLYGWRTPTHAVVASQHNNRVPAMGEDMTGEKMVLWLGNPDSGVEVEWDASAQEHVWSDIQGRQCSYPSPESLRRKIRLATDLEVAGVALWELGQMVTAHMDLF